MSNARSPRASCSMTIGTSGIGGERLAVAVGRPAPQLLACAGTALLLEAPLARCAGRLRRSAAAWDRQRAVDSLGEPLERQLAVAQLAARVLRDGCDPRAGPGHDALLLRVAQRGGGGHVEDRLHSRRRDVR